MTSTDQPARLSLPLWPLGTISGVVKVKEKGLQRPRRLLVRTLAAPAFLKRPPVPPGALDCPVNDKGAWSCSLPSATFDLVVTAEGFTPHYLWAVSVPAGKALSLGTLALERGASVAAWVAVEGGKIDPGHCVARLSPALAPGTDLRKSADLERTAVERPVGKDGFVQFAGLPPGVYSLEIRQQGYAPARLSPIRVDARAETFLPDPLVLTRPLDLSFEITPPLDWLGRPWRAQVFRSQEAASRIAPLLFEGAADTEGRFTIRSQASGRFRISLQDSLGNRLYSEEREVTEPVVSSLAVDLVDIAGRLRLGEEPLAADLWFGGRHGALAVKLQADEKGRFSGVLPREGMWPLDIAAAEPSLQVRTMVDVQTGQSGKATLEIDLPDTRLFGWVVDEQGERVPHAEVAVEGKSPEQLIETDDRGTFEIRGMREGLLKLAASSASRQSSLTYATLTEGNAVGPVELIVRPKQRLTGVVLSPRGPVAGARVLVGPFPPTGSGDSGTTETDGAFTVEIPPGTRQVVAIVTAPGLSLQAFAPLEATSLSLPMSEEGGSLDIEITGEKGRLAREDLDVTVFQNGIPIALSLLAQWARAQGQPQLVSSLHIPNVAPGDYRICLFHRQLAISLPSGSVPETGASCSSGLLAPGSTLSLRTGTPQ